MALGESAAVAVPLGVAAIGALGAFWAARRKMSGKIKSTEANSLWTESSAMRESYRVRAEKAEQENIELHLKNLELHSQLLEAQRTIAKLRNGYEEHDGGA